MTVFVCPKPRIWHEVHSRLIRAWKDAGKKPPKPPVPLILAGWNFSSDQEKGERWKQTIEWARSAGLEGEVPTLTEDMQYRVSRIDFTSSTD